MATYAVGDLQGCLDSLQALLSAVGFGKEDRLWLVGDLVNRGPKSLETLRFVRGLGDRARVVLGNHDLHLLAVAYGGARLKRKDTLREILDAADSEELLQWLRRQPLLHHEAGWIMVHAGLAPQWTAAQAIALADDFQRLLHGPWYRDFFAHMYGDQPARWDDALEGMDRQRFVVNALTRIRYVREDGSLTLKEKGPPDAEDPALYAWFAHPQRRNRDARIVFGHWATLQVNAALDPAHGVHHLDTGCVWGRTLSALRLDDGCSFSVPAAEPAARD